MLIYVKIIIKIKKKIFFCLRLFYDNFMLINVKKKKKKKCFYRTDRRTDGQTHVQLKTIVRNLTKYF
jgi:hypothetical protein